jgi:hypothetical protein
VGEAQLGYADDPGLARRAAKIQDFGLGVGVAEIRVGLTGKNPAERAMPLPRDCLICTGTTNPVPYPGTTWPYTLSDCVPRLPVTPTTVLRLPFGGPFCK